MWNIFPGTRMGIRQFTEESGLTGIEFMRSRLAPVSPEASGQCS